MLVIRRYTALRIDRELVQMSEVLGELRVGLSHGDTYNGIHANHEAVTEFDSEDAALVYAYNQDSNATWMIVPVVRFE